MDRGLMSRYVEHAGNILGATVVAAMWRDAIASHVGFAHIVDRPLIPDTVIEHPTEIHVGHRTTPRH
jgi:hypothetical protein